MESLRTTCCVVGGGPAGVMLGYLLARANVDVLVLEKHGDFFRDFRGDTVHPSTLDVMHELGLLDDLLSLPHQQLTSANGRVGDCAFQAADFSHLPTRCKFVALMPQWDFLKFLADRAKRFAHFQIRMGDEAVDLIRAGQTDHRSGDAVGGGACSYPGGPGSGVRRTAFDDPEGGGASESRKYGVPIDVLWFRISRQSRRSRANCRKYQLRKSAHPHQPWRVFSGRADYSERLVRARASVMA